MSLPSLHTPPTSDAHARRAEKPAKSKAKAVKQGLEDQAQAVRSLCKTYVATTQKLMYVFAALLDEESKDKGPKTTIDDALACSSRSMMIGEVTAALAGGVERIVRSTDLSMRSTVLRDLRARFSIAEAPPKPETAEKGTQATRERSARVVNTSEAAEQPSSTEASRPNSRLSRSERASSAAPASGRGSQHDGAAQTLDQAVGDGEATEEANTAKAAKVPHTVAIYDRLKAWEARKAERVANERKAKEERESNETASAAKEAKKRSSVLYGHIESAVKLERQKEEDNKLAQAEARIESEVHARERAETALRERQEEQKHIAASLREAEEAQRRMAEELEEARAENAAAAERYAELEAKAVGTAETLEIAECLDGRKFEEWPMMPGKRVLRVQATEEFDGRVSSEYRVKDMESGERGVALLMGRSVKTRQPEAQCVIFDPKYMSDLQAARWWSANHHRFGPTPFWSTKR